MSRAQRLRVLERLADRVHRARPARRPRRRPRSTRPSCACASTALIASVERGEVRHARGVGGEARIVAPLRMTEHVGDALPVRLVRAADVDPAVARGERLVRRGQQVRRAGRPGRFAGREIRSPRASTSAAARLPSATCRRPGPARSCCLCAYAARMPTAARMPALMSATELPVFTGGRPGSPVIDIRPAKPCAIRSKPPLSA